MKPTRLFYVVLVLLSQIASAQVQEEWVRRYVGPNRDDRPFAIQVDAAGEAHVTGSSSTTNGYDFATVKYTSAGSMLWAAPYNSAAGNSADFAIALALDSSGTVFVLGSSDDLLAPPARMTLVAYGSDGEQHWVARYTEGGATEPVALLVGADAIYAVASNYSVDSAWDYVTVKFDPVGNILWSARYTGKGQSQETVAGLALDPSGNVIVTGTTYSDGFPTLATVKYDRDGSAL